MLTPKKIVEPSPRSKVLQVCDQEDYITFLQCIPDR